MSKAQPPWRRDPVGPLAWAGVALAVAVWTILILEVLSWAVCGSR